MPDQVSDLILTLMLLSTFEIAESHEEIKNEINKGKVNEIAKKWNVSNIYLDMYHK